MIRVSNGKAIISGSPRDLQEEMATLGEALRFGAEEKERNMMVFAFMGGLLMNDEDIKTEFRNDPDFDKLINEIKGEEEEE